MTASKTLASCGCVAILALVARSSQPARAMDCNKAANASEKAICGNKDLLALDVRLNAQYARVRLRTPMAKREQLHAQQQDWLAQRDKCGADAACLKAIVETRVAELALTGDKLLQLARKRKPDIDKDLDPENCQYSGRDQYTVAVLKDGLLFQPNFAHSDRACEFQVTLPWADLQPFIARKGPLAPPKK